MIRTQIQLPEKQVMFLKKNGLRSIRKPTEFLGGLMQIESKPGRVPSC
jgi:hypothetical protein